MTNFFGSNEGIGLISDQHTVPDPEQRAAYFPWFGGPAPDGGTLRWPNPIAGGFDTRLVDPVTGEEITTPDRPGELRVGGPTVFAGYWGSSSADPFDEHGRLRTGDLFAIAAHDPSLLRYVDRARDVVVRGGMNVAPAELEALIGALPGIAEVAVVGTPDERLGERVAAVVVPAADTDPPTLDSVVAALRERRIASYKLPERLEIVDGVAAQRAGQGAQARAARGPGLSRGGRRCIRRCGRRAERGHTVPRPTGPGQAGPGRRPGDRRIGADPAVSGRFRTQPAIKPHRLHADPQKWFAERTDSGGTRPDRRWSGAGRVTHHS